jgi:hypothetical protein
MMINSTAEALLTEIARCQSEIAAIEGLISAGHPDGAGLCMALLDWNAELFLITQELEVKRRTAAE